ncbi:MAG: rod-binding protein [Pseudomonadota bacterium]
MEVPNPPDVRPSRQVYQNSTGTTARRSGAEKAAVEFETVFLAEMLRHTGLGKAREAFGGGAGEEVFSSLMTREWARNLAENGGIGLADRLLQGLQVHGGSDVGQ